MKKVYFYLIFDSNSYNVCECWQSKIFNSIKEAFESKEFCDSQTSPIMEGWIKE